VSFSPDTPSLLAAGGSKGKLGVWNTLEQEAMQQRLPDAQAALDADGKVLSGAVAGMGELNVNSSDEESDAEEAGLAEEAEESDEEEGREGEERRDEEGAGRRAKSTSSRSVGARSQKMRGAGGPRAGAHGARATKARPPKGGS